MKEITDEEAIQALKLSSSSRFGSVQFATKFVPRTIWHSVAVDYGTGQNIELRAFLTQGTYCSEAQWEQAVALEKKFLKLNKDYQKLRESQGKPVNIKEPGNPLKATKLGQL